MSGTGDPSYEVMLSLRRIKMSRKQDGYPVNACPGKVSCYLALWSMMVLEAKHCQRGTSDGVCKLMCGGGC
jgi:hypothetical protein